MNRTSTVALLTSGLLLLPGVALAHPGLNPNSGPAGETITSTLVIPHGCAPGGGMPEGDEAEASPTVEIALQHTDGVQIEALDVEGWTTEDDGEALVWTDAGGSTTDVIQLPVTITLTGETGDSLYVNAYQECASGDAFQWIATPDVDAEWPAVYLAVADEVGVAAAPTHSDADHGDMEMADDDGGMDEMTDDEMADVETADDETAEDEMADDGMPMDEGVTDEMEMDQAADEDEGGSTGLLVLGGVLLLALAGGGLAMRGRGTDA